MKILIRHVFGVQAYSSFTDAANVGKILLVARYAARMLICQDISVAGETLIT